jgi:multiple sugar transport system ATP-binding protein
VARFIGSPWMNCLQACLIDAGSGGVQVRFDGRNALELPASALHQRPGLRRFVGRPVIVGIRPEDMEDAEIVRAAPGMTLCSVAELVEPVGSDMLVHFPIEARGVLADQHGEISDDSATGERRTVLVGRFSPRSRVFEGQRIQVWVDTSRLYFFDPATGVAIYHDMKDAVDA